MRVVLDTGVYVSTLLQPAGVPAQIVAAWQQERFELITAPAILHELRNTLNYPRIRRKYPYTDQQIESFLALLREEATVVPGTADVSGTGIRDPNDLIILACAADGNADVIVTGDQDLLVLGTFHRTRIVTPREFLHSCLPPPPASP